MITIQPGVIGPRQARCVNAGMQRVGGRRLREGCALDGRKHPKCHQKRGGPFERVLNVRTPVRCFGLHDDDRVPHCMIQTSFCVPCTTAIAEVTPEASGNIDRGELELPQGGRSHKLSALRETSGVATAADFDGRLL